MKIDGNNIGGISPESPLQKPGGAQSSEAARRAARLGYGASAAEGAAPPEDTTPPDEVELSDLGRQLIKLAQSDPEREARIEKLAAEYGSGRLQTDTSAVARKMVDDALNNDDAG